MKNSYKAQFYQTEQGDVPLTQYLAKLRDTRAMVKISTRISRVETGNFGDHKSVGGGLWEMRIDYGPAIGCTTALRAIKLCCYCALEIKGRNPATLNRR